MLNPHQNLKPIEQGNAKHIQEVSSAVHPLLLLRYDSMATFYTEEPLSIHLKRTENEEYFDFEQVLRYRVWTGRKTESWSIYAENRCWINDEPGDENADEQLGGLVIRHVVWDRISDLGKAKALANDERKMMRTQWPNLTSNNIYLPREKSDALIQKLLKFDKLIQNGILIRERNQAEPQSSRNDLEVWRLFDWGQVHSIWDRDQKENTEVESYLLKLESEWEDMMQGQTVEIDQMDLNYSCPTDLWKSLVEGTWKKS